MKLLVNGEGLEIASGTTVADLVERLRGQPRGLAVAVNEEVVPRSTWEEVQLRQGDRVEVLGATQGG